jgi:hypothetical protein
MSRVAVGGDRLVGRPPLQLVGQRPARRVAVLRLQGHRPEADRLEGPLQRRLDLPGRGELAPLDLAEDLADVVPLEGGPAGQQAVECRTQDESHGVIRPTVGIRAEAVGRHDAGMLQPAGDLGLEQESLPAGGVVGVPLEDLLERHLAVQLAVQGHEDGPQAAPGVRAQEAEPLAVAGGRADGVAGGAVGVSVLGRSMPGVRMVERPVDLRVAELRQALACRLAGRQCGEALFHVAAVRLEVDLGQGLPAPAWHARGRRGIPGGRPGSSTSRASTPGRRARAGPG